MKWFKRHIGTYAKRTARLTMLQHGAYTLLMDTIYDQEYFPTIEEVNEWLWLDTASDDEIAAVNFILKRFFELDEDNRYVNSRIEREIAQYRLTANKNQIIALNREAAKREAKLAGKRLPSSKHVDITNEYEACESVHGSSTNEHQILNKNKKEEVIKDKTDVSVFDFNSFWDIYDKKSGRKKCEDKYSKLTEAQRDLIKRSLQAYVNSTNTDGSYPTRKDPLTYLNGECWNDELILTTTNRGYKNGQQQSASQLTSDADAQRYMDELRGYIPASTAVRNVN